LKDFLREARPYGGFSQYPPQVSPTGGYFVYTNGGDVCPRTSTATLRISYFTWKLILEMYAALTSDTTQLYGVLTSGHAKARKSKDWHEFFTTKLDPAMAKLMQDVDFVKWFLYKAEFAALDTATKNLYLMVDLLFDMKYSSNLPDIAKEIKLFIGSHSNPISNISVDTLRTVFTALGLVPTLPPNVSLLTHQQFQKELDSKFKELRDFAQGLLVQNVLATDVKSLSGYTYVVNKLLEKI
jgi:hypothetical protein